jgi:ammonia channel protein AmtB
LKKQYIGWFGYYAGKSLQPLSAVMMPSMTCFLAAATKFIQVSDTKAEIENRSVCLLYM